LYLEIFLEDNPNTQLVFSRDSKPKCYKLTRH